MKSLKDYQEAFADAVRTNKAKFPHNDKWTAKDRMLSMQRQLADIGAAMHKNEGIYDKEEIKTDTGQRIAGLIADTLLLCEKLTNDEIYIVDIDKEVDQALKWYREPVEKK